MLKSSVFRYCLYGSCVIFTSELLYHSYFWIKKKLEERSASQEVCEVIWTNELTQSCIAKHRVYKSNNSGGGNNTSNNSPTQSRFLKFLTLSKSKGNCENPFCAAKNVGRLVELIDSAKYSIDVAMYTFTSFEISQAFSRALQRGVFIRIISDHEMAYSSGSQIIPLTKAGVPVRCNSNTVFMHHKFCILDSPRRVAEIYKKQRKTDDKGYAKSLLLTGSLNWTMQGFSGNWENILITSKMVYIQKYSEEFERMWHVFDVDLKAIDKN